MGGGLVKRPAAYARGILADLRLTVSQLRDPTLIVWALYLFLFPVYVWKSGLPQPGDMLLILFAPAVLVTRRGRLPAVHEGVMRSLWLFIGWVVAVNLTWTIILNAWTLQGKTSFLWSPLFYLYNVVVFLVFLLLYQRYGSKLLFITAKLVLYTLVFQAVIVTLLVGGRQRTIGLFNNPNQLGYYALLSASLLVILQRRRYLGTLEVVVGSLAATYLALLSASKAALGGIIILGVVSTVARFRTMLAIALVLVPLFVIPSPMTDAFDRAMTRIESDVSPSFMQERGYDRVLQHPQYWVLGAGEGYYKRFDDGALIGSHEIHSSFGTLLFCYGVVGIVLFGVFIWVAVRGSGLRTWLLLLPTLAYGATHQSLRFTLFWVLLAVIVAMRSEQHAERTKHKPSSDFTRW
jgi:hypothetical protein